MSKTLIVNLYGSPCTGKSTAAAKIFAKLKMRGVNAELVTEYAKSMVYENRNNILSNQIYMFAKQFRSIERLLGKVDVIITDSPIDLCKYYGGNLYYKKELNALIDIVNVSLDDQLNFFLVRDFEYKEEGRIQTKEEIALVDEEMDELFSSKCLKVVSNKNNINHLTDLIYDKLMTLKA